MKIKRSLDRAITKRMNEHAAYKDQILLKVESSQIQELKKF